MARKKKHNQLEIFDDKVSIHSGHGQAYENQNQNHNTQKEALGPNTKR